MAGKTLDLDDIIVEDQLGTEIARTYQTWVNGRQAKTKETKELRSYLFATDTTKTSNASLPWKNKTTIPKLTQIRDNLFANYMASLFPKKAWLKWEGDDKDSEKKNKRDTIENYMKWVVSQRRFKKEVAKLVLDYIDEGNAFATSEWVDERVDIPEQGKTQVGYVGPAARRVSPVDIVFNPVAPDFESSPKIIRTLMTMGEAKEQIEKLTGDKEEAEAIFAYLREMREQVATFAGDLNVKDEYFNVDGFDSFRLYLDSNYLEVLTFYGDMYDRHTDTFYKNHIITVIDRHKVIAKKPNPSFFGVPGIYHSGWRVRQDNLWAMGPLDNLVGMQYRLDHLENLKADLMDFATFPMLKIKGYIDDFEWEPGGRVFVGDEGDIETLLPDANALSVNLELQSLEEKMEMMAGAPREALGIRSPGEKTKFEVQTLDNAAGRIFQNKIAQFEEEILEPLLNDMLEHARRRMDAITIRIFDEEGKFASFASLTPEDITGVGRIRPMAARHFAEKAQRMQDLTTFMSSALGQDQEIKQHFSSIKLAQMAEDLLDLGFTNVVDPYVRISEQADAARLANSAQEEVAVEAGTPSGVTPEDTGEGPPL